MNSQFALPQKRLTTLKLSFEQLKRIEELYPAINSCIEDVQKSKPVKYLQDLSEDICLGIQNPYVCV